MIANDRPDLAVLAGCGGLHVGQHDLPPPEARQVIAARSDERELPGGCAIGMSVHDLDELEVALAAEPDYLAFGPVFGTRSKADPEPTIGVEGLRRLVAATEGRFSGPLVGIGGIDESNVEQIRRHVRAAAVISALLPRPDSATPYADATARARALAARLPEASWT